MKPVNVVPVRTSLTQYGVAAPVTLVAVVVPPVEVRRWKEAVPVGLTSIMASVELAARDSRIMTPAFAQVFVFCTLATRAMI